MASTEQVLRVIGSEDTMDEDDLLSETDEAAEGLRRLIASGDVDMATARPIPIPSHKRSTVVKYEEGKC